jgi:hypothetical protein
MLDAPSNEAIRMNLSKACTRCGQLMPTTREFFGSTPSGGLKGFCRECERKASRKFEADNKDRRRARDEKRAEAAGGFRRSFPVSTKGALFGKQNGLCPCCFKPIDRPEHGEVDHMVPLSRGGRDDESNFFLTHAQCNREKKNKTLQEHWDWRVKVGLDTEHLGRKHGLSPRESEL